ncbi:unnamed protein product [Cylindrotheca closterium]|uniref:Phosducin thioredoxin-like domain-containing protein n=1 Tax=Cylindrotheca closterium TaxID=2856 RepID=A0AAD2PW93_9STRA|nr:unnamed protein product [Cylindrotheca closterium]
MSHIECSHDVKPQSILHHIGRLGFKIAKPIANRRKRTRMERTVQKGSMKQSVAQSVSDTMESSEDGSFQQEDYHDAMNGEEDEFSLSFSDFEVKEECRGIFETLDQNEFLTECFVANGRSDIVFLVHFFNQGTFISNAIEDVLSKRVRETNSKCECRRINSTHAPLSTIKLQIDPEQPTVVAIKNGKVLGKVSDISSSECTELDQWLARTGILQKVATGESFSGLSTTMYV